jgi:hypothetical protein
MKKYYYLFAVVLLLLVSCSHEKRDWQNAKIQNDVQTYQKFIGKYPKSIFNDSVNNSIKKLEFSEIYNKKDIIGIQKFIINNSDAGVINEYKIKNPTSIVSQPKNANKGCRIALKELNDNEFTYLLTVPPTTFFNPDLGFDANVHLVKGDLLVTISNGGTSGYKSTSGGTILSIIINKKNYLKLNSEYIEIAPNLLVSLDKSEFLISGKDSVLLKREVSQNKFYIEKGNIYYFKL